MSEAVMYQHIDLYVNSYSIDLGAEGKRAGGNALRAGSGEGYHSRVRAESLPCVDGACIMRLSRKAFLNAVAGAAAGTVAGTVAGGARAQTANPHPKKVEGTAIKGATTAVRNFITSTSLGAMPDAVVQQGKRCLIDGFGVILAGSTVRRKRDRSRATSSRRTARRKRPRLGADRHDGSGRAGGARQRRQRPRDGLRRHAAVDDA